MGESIYKGDSVFTVHDVITPRHIFENSPQLVDSISKAQVQLTIRDLLIIWLLTEKKNQDSKYFGYIQSLPDTSTCPFSKSNSAWQCLPLQVKSCLLKLYFTDFKQRYKLVQKVIECTFEDFKWVAWVIRSRWVIAVDPSLTKDFDVPWLEITGARNDWGSLGPWFDMMNHSANNYNVGYQFKPGSGLEITALRDISPEEELLITYGNNSDDDMFMFYGFCNEAGENGLSCLLFPLNEIEREMESNLNITTEQLNMTAIQLSLIKLGDDKSKFKFRMYSNARAPELLLFIIRCLGRRDREETTSKNRHKVEAFKFIETLLTVRAKEIE